MSTDICVLDLFIMINSGTMKLMAITKTQQKVPPMSFSARRSTHDAKMPSDMLEAISPQTRLLGEEKQKAKNETL